jgi:hypothetical protein
MLAHETRRTAVRLIGSAMVACGETLHAGVVLAPQPKSYSPSVNQLLAGWVFFDADLGPQTYWAIKLAPWIAEKMAAERKTPHIAYAVDPISERELNRTPLRRVAVRNAARFLAANWDRVETLVTELELYFFREGMVRMDIGIPVDGGQAEAGSIFGREQRLNAICGTQMSPWFDDADILAI